MIKTRMGSSLIGMNSSDQCSCLCFTSCYVSGEHLLCGGLRIIYGVKNDYYTYSTSDMLTWIILKCLCSWGQK